MSTFNINIVKKRNKKLSCEGDKYIRGSLKLTKKLMSSGLAQFEEV